jgi:menaquinone-dependent protoporphyrinogen IX oxidase
VIRNTSADAVEGLQTRRITSAAQQASGDGMNSIVLFSSKTGNTEKYAMWIAEELGAKAVPANKVKVKDLKEYDNIIYGAGIYAERINGIKFIKKNLKKLGGKRIIVFANGFSLNDKESIDKIKEKNFTPGELKQIEFFYMRGAFYMEKLPLKEKMMMTVVKKAMKDKEGLEEDEKMLIDALNAPFDHVDKNNITDLINYIRSSQDRF